jgi:hypothetical protein
VELAESHQAGIALYPLVYVNPSPTDAVFQNMIDECRAAIIDASTGDRYKIGIRNEKNELLIDMLLQRGEWIDKLAGNDRNIAVVSMLPLKKVRGTAPPITSVKTPEASNGANVGEVNLKTERIPGASYLYYYTTDLSLPVTSWPNVPCRRIKCTIKGLASATRYYFIVAAFGSNEQLVYSLYTTFVTQ